MRDGDLRWGVSGRHDLEGLSSPLAIPEPGQLPSDHKSDSYIQCYEVERRSAADTETGNRCAS